MAPSTLPCAFCPSPVLLPRTRTCLQPVGTAGRPPRKARHCRAVVVCAAPPRATSDVSESSAAVIPAPEAPEFPVEPETPETPQALITPEAPATPESVTITTTEGTDPIATKSAHNFGFASLLGPSNSGKSTLLNRLVGSKVAIVTPKVQTTRCRIAGIVQHGRAQIAYLDTPGIFETNARLGRAMVKTAWRSGDDADAIAIILDAADMHFTARRRALAIADEEGLDEEAAIDAAVQNAGVFVPAPLALVLDGMLRRVSRGGAPNLCFCANKMDSIAPHDRARCVDTIKTMLAERGFEEPLVFPMSATGGMGVDLFSDWTARHMPKGDWMYPEDYATDMSARLVASEVTREKIFLLLKQELPYEIAVETTSYKVLGKDGSIRVTQDILVRRDSQLKIVTGKGGAMVKKIGMQSRQELKEILGENVHLMLRVKVKQNWKENKDQYEQWGLDYSA
eukprot:IDg21655t1